MYSISGGGAGPVADAGVESRRFTLKHATDAAHRRVEDIVQAAGMFGSLDGYRRFLSATYRIREKLERELHASGASRAFPGWPERRIADLLAADIVDLGGCV